MTLVSDRYALQGEVDISLAIASACAFHPSLLYAVTRNHVTPRGTFQSSSTQYVWVKFGMEEEMADAVHDCFMDPDDTPFGYVRTVHVSLVSRYHIRYYAGVDIATPDASHIPVFTISRETVHAPLEFRAWRVALDTDRVQPGSDQATERARSLRPRSKS